MPIRCSTCSMRWNEPPPTTGSSAWWPRVGSGSPGVARAQEIADAVTTFTAAGKPTIAYAETFGELQSGSLTERPASLQAFDELYLQPGGELGITGLVHRKFYLRGLLDKLGITPQLDHRHEYKAAKYVLTEDHMVEPDREATTKYVDAQFEQLIDGIATGRSLATGRSSEALSTALRSWRPKPRKPASSTTCSTGTRCTTRSGGAGARTAARSIWPPI